MKPIFSKTTDSFILIAKLSEDKMKLFLDVEPILPEASLAASPAAPPPPQAAETSQTQSAQANQPAKAPPTPATPPPAQPEPKQVKRDDLMAVLKEFANLEMINLGVIDDIAARLSKGEKVEERRIAKGQEPEMGADGKILFLVKRFTGEVEVKIDEKGVADLKVLNLFDNITQGTTVARIYAPKNGTDGKDALGKVIPAKAGKPCKLGLDRTLVQRDSGDPDEKFQILVAEADGYLSEESGKLSIKPELVVGGDLDFHMGTIDFIGAVRIKGDVMPGFSVRAKRGIVVAGSVREASLVCPEGDIMVKGYVFGGPTAKITCGRNFECSVAQELDVEAVGNISVEKEATDCRLRTQSSLYIKKGALIGGQTYAVCGVEAKILGNDAGQETIIHLCNSVEMTVEYGLLISNIENHERALKMIDFHLGPYAANPGRIEVLSGPYRAKIERLLEKRKEVGLSHQRLLKKKEEMLEGSRTNPVMRVNFFEKLYDGVQILAGEDAFSTKQPLDGPGSLDYIAEEKTFKVGELKGLECSIHTST